MFFGAIANILFFQRWYSRLGHSPIFQNLEWQTPHWPHLGWKFKRKITIEKNSPEYELLQEEIFFDNICEINGEYFFVIEKGDTVIVQDITSETRGQLWLLYTTGWLIIIFGILSYLISRYFVQTALEKLKTLIAHLRTSDLDNLTTLPIVWNPEDEINIVGIKINEFLEKIDHQSIALKDFVANASHELRTPMMNINSDIDYAMKAKKYKSWLEKTKQWIRQINTLLDQLFLLTKMSSQESFSMKKENIAPLMQWILEELEKKYQQKNITITTDLKKSEQNINKKSFEIIIKNLIENAFKYTEKGEIHITNTTQGIIISDTGIGIEKKHLNNIRERFRQADSSKWKDTGFGLGLHLVKLLVEKHLWIIDVKSTKNKGTTFTITF